MLQRVRLVLPIVLTLSVTAAWADSLPAGYVSWDETFPGNAGQFDIVNLTGPNSFDPIFPIATSLNLSSLSLLVHFSNGSSQTFGSSYFTLAGDGLSFNGGPIAIGGTNPLPTDATLTGVFSPLSITRTDGSTDVIAANFSAMISPSTGRTLSDGDLAVIYATTGGGPAPVPEPGSIVLLGSVMLGLVLLRFRHRIGGLRSLPGGRSSGMRILLVVLCLALGQYATASAAVQLATWTAPDNGVAGVNNVNVTGSGFPAGTITPANVNVVFHSGSCAGAVAATAVANSVKTVLLSTKRVNVTLPGTLAQGTYFVSISDSTAGDANFSSGNCSEVNVTHTNPTLSACVPTSSLGVLAPTATGPVTAYVPNGAWAGGTTGIQVVPIEGGGSPTSVSTAQRVNSCSSNPATGQTVCVANNTDVYLLTGTSLTNTLTSSSNALAGFSGGSCQNCGVAINALANKAVIAMGLNPSPSNSGIQMLDLNTNTFEPAIPLTHVVSEDISIDPTRNLILSPSETNFYDLLQIQSNGSSVNQFANFVSTGGEFDSAAEDCSTGIALASLEFTSNVYIADLTQAAFDSVTHTWTAPQQVQTLTGTAFSAGTSGISVAPGSSHLAIVTGEFGGATFAVLQLPSTSGSGTPAILDYAYATMPPTPAGGFSAGLDPHTVTAYTSPNDGKAYGLMASGGPPPNYLGIIDLAALLAAPRTAGTHTVDPTYNLLTNGVVRYVATH